MQEGTNRHSVSQSDIQSASQSVRQTHRQTDRWTERKTETYWQPETQRGSPHTSGQVERQIAEIYGHTE